MPPLKPETKHGKLQECRCLVVLEQNMKQYRCHFGVWEGYHNGRLQMAGCAQVVNKVVMFQVTSRSAYLGDHGYDPVKALQVSRPRPLDVVQTNPTS